MPRHSKSSPLNDRRLRAIVGPACYVECALAAGRIWHHEALERALGGKGTDADLLPDPMWRPPQESHLFRMMLVDRVPEEDTLRAVEDQLERGHPNVVAWRNHPLWDLLTEEITVPAILNALDGLHGKHRDCLFDEAERGFAGSPALRYGGDLAALKELRRLGGIDGLIALVAHARESQLLRIHMKHARAAWYARKIFPKVVGRSPHLFIRWRSLAQLLAQRVWSPPEEFGSVFWCDMQMDKLETEVAEVAGRSRRKGIQLPPDNLVIIPPGWSALIKSKAAAGATVPARPIAPKSSTAPAPPTAPAKETGSAGAIAQISDADS